MASVRDRRPQRCFASHWRAKPRGGGLRANCRKTFRFVGDPCLGSHENNPNFVRLFFIPANELELLQERGKIELMNQPTRQIRQANYKQAQSMKGFSQTILFGIIAVLILVWGGGFATDFFPKIFSKQAKEEACAIAAQPREFSYKPYYTGQLIDAHVHLPTSSKIVSTVSVKLGRLTPVWDKNLSLDYMNCLFETEGTLQAFGFHLLTKYSSGGEVRVAKQMEKKYPGKITHFLMPTFISPWINVSADTVRDILADNPQLFKGIGELKMFDGTNPDDPRLLELYDIAKEYNLIIMMHPFDHHKEAVEKVVKQYPGIKFLLHGIDEDDERGPHGERRDNIDWVISLIKRYDNVYYSVDDTVSIYGFRLEHEKIKPTKEESLPYIRGEFGEKLEKLVKRWKASIESYPDRFLSGTDRQYGWHFDQDASGLVIEFKRAFIGQLSPAVQEKYAYENAKKLLENSGKK